MSVKFCLFKILLIYIFRILNVSYALRIKQLVGFLWNVKVSYLKISFIMRKKEIFKYNLFLKVN
jgi:hypothetical protein